ncbi:MAG: ROK family protein [Lentisphaeria bacterium]|nr:ROK family protein [Lentisphaeria bacterium]
MKRQTTAQLRRSNHNLVRNVMLTQEAWTKESLASATGLSQSTCHNILMDMLSSGEAAELSHGASEGGRPARRFQYCRTSTLFAFVLLQCENQKKSVSILVTDAGGTILSEKKQFAGQMSVELLRKILREAMAEYPGIRAVGVSYPGAVRNGKTACWSDMEELTGLDLQALLRQQLQLPLYIENDVNLGAWGYAQKHLAETDTFAYIAFPRGNLPGCGLVLNGQLFQGCRGFAGEVLYIQNQDWDEQRKRLQEKHGFADMVLQMLRPITALLDPDRIVVAGDDISEDDIACIREKCRAMVRHDFLPELIFRKDYSEDNLAGLLNCVQKTYFMAD